MRDVTFTLARPYALLNQIMRMHHRALARYQVELAWQVRTYPGLVLPAEPFRRARVRIIRRSVGTPDRDGLFGGAKPLIDVLLPLSKRHPRGLGIITDDNPACCELVVLAERAIGRTDQCTRVLVEEVA